MEYPCKTTQDHGRYPGFILSKTPKGELERAGALSNNNRPRRRKRRGSLLPRPPACQKRLFDKRNPRYREISWVIGTDQSKDFIVGNSSTSRMLAESVSSMTRRSTPKPRPPVGGKMALSGHQGPISAVPQGFSRFCEAVSSLLDSLFLQVQPEGRRRLDSLFRGA